MPKLKLTVTAGNGYSVFVTHYGVKVGVLQNKPYPFDFRNQATGYIADMNAFYMALGYAAQTVNEPNVWEYRVGGVDTILLDIHDHAVTRIRLELVENAPGYIPPPFDDDETLELTADERAELAEIEERIRHGIKGAAFLKRPYINLGF